MKQLAYKNPFELQTLSFWNELKKYPHLCVSQTLVEGLKAYYGRESFSLLCTIDLFLKQFYSEWHGDNELKLFQTIHLSNAIKKIKDTKLQSSFKHNQNDILKSIRFIIECGIKPEDIVNKTHLTEEQLCLIDLYEELYEIDCFQSLFHQSERGSDGLLTCVKEILFKEMERNLVLLPKPNASDDERIKEIKKELIKKSNKNEENLSLQHVMNLLENLGSEDVIFSFDKVFIHGVHQFTPLIYKFINRLNELGVEVIFLFNYCEEFSSIYNTWDKVYRWTKRDTEQHGSLFSILPRQLGENMGSVFEGRVKDIQKTDEFLYKFDNLTSFTDYVSPIYEDAQEKARQSGSTEKIAIIKNMSEQFYAVDGSEINSLLKVYFPEHFGDRHFLSYPIGQFILGIYNMWDSKNKQIKIDERNLKECLALNIWKFREGLTPLQMFYDMSLYFKGAHTFTDYMDRLDKIKRTVSLSNRDRTKRLSFFSYTKDDVESFIQVIEYINNFATQLFKTGQDDLRSHYKELIEYISTNMNSAEISKKEQSFIDEIKNRLETIEIEDIVADIEDIRNTLHFYLTTNENKDQEAEWIVRDFEQIDGGVLLAKAKDDKKRANRHAVYHFAGLSDENLLSKTKKSLPFPITIEMIDGMNEISSLVALCKKEYIHFLRFSLFYGTYFLSALNPISLSFIEELEEEKAEPYSIFKILNLPVQDWLQVDKFDDTEPLLPYNDRSTVPLDNNLDESMKRSANACYLRFLFNHCLDPFPFYNDEFNLFYVSQLLATYTIIDKNRYHNIPMGKTLKQFTNLFPFMSSLDFKQIEKMVLRDRHSSLEPKYVDTKLEFKYFSWKTDQGENLFRNITFVPRENTKPYKNFVKNLDRFINDDNKSFLPEGHNWKICDVCNQKYVCGYGLKVKENS